MLETQRLESLRQRGIRDPIDDVAGIYIWATALDGRGILGLGNVAEHLSKRRFRFKDWVLPAAIERVRRKLAGADDGNRQMS